MASKYDPPSFFISMTQTSSIFSLLLHCILILFECVHQIYILYLDLFFFSPASHISVFAIYATLFIKKLWLTEEVPSVLGSLSPGSESEELL